MLILTRKYQEEIVIGDKNGVAPFLRVVVIGIKNGKVRLGIEAADNLYVHRREVWERIQEEAQMEEPLADPSFTVWKDEPFSKSL